MLLHFIILRINGAEWTAQQTGAKRPNRAWWLQKMTNLKGTVGFYAPTLDEAIDRIKQEQL